MGTEEGENILFETGANHFKNVEATGGKLYLTNKRLVFISHKLNVQNQELSIPVSEIVDTEKYKKFGIIDNGLVIPTTDYIEKFVVQKGNEWIKKIGLAKEGLPQAV